MLQFRLRTCAQPLGGRVRHLLDRLALDLNYFSYFSEIEDTFIRRRGKHLMLSPMDWALIEGWKERGVPLHVVVRAIEHAFD